MLTAHAISVIRGSKRLLDDVSVACQPGRVCVILGPNGAGKSTLLKVLSGALEPDGGQVEINGRPLHSLSRRELAKLRGFLAQESPLQFDFSVEEIVILGRIPHLSGWEGPRDRAICERALRDVEMSAFRHRRYPTLSGGERQRVHLARVLAQMEDPEAPGPRWLLLDEPTSALDLRHQHTTLALVRRLARNRGFGVCAVLHDINLALRYADDLLLLDRGRLATAGPIGSALREDLVSRVWGIEARLVQPAGVSSPFIHTEIPEPASDHERT